MPRKLASDKVADQIVDKLLLLPLGATPTDTLEVLKSVKCKPSDLAYAFQKLDSQYGLWSNWNQWHFRIRQLRNDPNEGRKMFKLFEG